MFLSRPYRALVLNQSTPRAARSFGTLALGYIKPRRWRFELDDASRRFFPACWIPTFVGMTA
jgi:hypothetical protein